MRALAQPGVESLDPADRGTAVLGGPVHVRLARQRLADAGITINRPPRDGQMAFVRSPDGISIELLQAGEALPPAEPWTSMANTGSW